VTANRTREFAVLALLTLAGVSFASDLIAYAGPRWGEDVAQHWVASRVVAGGGDPYSPGELRAAGEAAGLVAPGQPTDHFLERHYYPPLALVVSYPLSWMSYAHARITWLIVSALAALACIPLLIGVAGLPPGGEPARLLTAAFLVFLPVRGALGLGQPDIVLFALLLLALRWDRNGRSWLAGAPLAVAALLKLLPIAWLVYFVASRRWKTTASTLCWAAACTVGSWIVVPPGLYLSFVRAQWSFAGAAEGWQRYEPTNISVTAWLVKSLAFVSGGHELEPLGVGAGRLLALVVLVVIGWRIAAQPADARRGLQGLGLLCAGIALISPLTWQHHLVLLALPLALGLRAAWESGDRVAFVRDFLAPWALVGLIDPRFPPLRDLSAQLSKPVRDAVWSVLPLAVTAGVVLIAWNAWRATSVHPTRAR
jgi:hypothetical protein